MVLTCRAAVNPGVNNTLRLVIADASDGILDSGVFLQANGVSSNPIGPLQPISPNRLLDTRRAGDDRRRRTEAIVPGGTSISLKVTGGEVPETALAVALNVTAVDGAGSGFLTIFPDGGTQPGTSSVNFAPGAASPNSVMAKIGTGGRIRIFANVSVNVVVDVFGWFGPGGNARLFTVVPNRVLDTRDSGVPVGSLQTIDVQVAGTAKVPVGASAAVLNVTATEAIGPGYLTVFPSNRDLPLVSSVNYETGVPRPNSVIAPLGPDGKIKIFSNQQTHVVVDVMGWFGTPVRRSTSRSRPRVCSTPACPRHRPQGGRRGDDPPAGRRRGRAAQRALRRAERDRHRPKRPGFLTVYPGGAIRPLSSNLNYVTGQTIPNAVIVGLGPTGTVDIFSLAASHVVVDVVGYFA